MSKYQTCYFGLYITDHLSHCSVHTSVQYGIALLGRFDVPALAILLFPMVGHCLGSILGLRPLYTQHSAGGRRGHDLVSADSPRLVVVVRVVRLQLHTLVQDTWGQERGRDRPIGDM